MQHSKKHQSPLPAQISPPVSTEYFVAYPHRYSFILDEPNRCREESPFLVLMIPVAPDNREARDTIRNTWVKETTVLSQVVSHYFLLGLSKEEDRTEALKEQVSLLIFKMTEFPFAIPFKNIPGVHWGKIQAHFCLQKYQGSMNELQRMLQRI